MNFKQNSWMFLFLASVLLWVGTVTFSCESGPKDGAATNLTANCTIDSSNYQLDPTVARARIKDYVVYADTTFPSIDTSRLNSDSTGILVNPNVQYFHLPNCELSDMVAQVKPGADVKAHLAMKEVVVNGVKVEEIVLVFETVRASDSKTYYYDFVKPCPRHCPK